MDVQHHNAITAVAGQVADYLAERGYAFVEDDMVEDLAEALTAFLRAAAIPIHSSREAASPTRAAEKDPEERAAASAARAAK